MEQIKQALPTVTERGAAATGRKALLSQRQLLWLWVLLGCGALIAGSPALLGQHGELEVAASWRRRICWRVESAMLMIQVARRPSQCVPVW